MKIIKSVISIIIFFLCVYAKGTIAQSSGTQRVQQCPEYPTNDQVIDSSVNNFVDLGNRFGVDVSNLINSLTPEQRKQYLLLYQTDSTVITTYFPVLQSQQYMIQYTRMREQFIIAFNRYRELNPHTDTISAANQVLAIANCCSDTKIENQNPLAKMYTDCDKIFKRCRKSANRSYFWCLFWGGGATIGASIFGTPAAGVVAAVTSVGRCATRLYSDFEECDDEYDDCSK
jgi:hypothetical protein